VAIASHPYLAAIVRNADGRWRVGVNRLPAMMPSPQSAGCMHHRARRRYLPVLRTDDDGVRRPSSCRHRAVCRRDRARREGLVRHHPAGKQSAPTGGTRHHEGLMCGGLPPVPEGQDGRQEMWP